MSTTSFLAFALLVVLITLSWSQPGKAAPILDNADPERAADKPDIHRQKRCANQGEKCSKQQALTPLAPESDCCNWRHSCIKYYHNDYSFCDYGLWSFKTDKKAFKGILVTRMITSHARTDFLVYDTAYAYLPTRYFTFFLFFFFFSYFSFFFLLFVYVSNGLQWKQVIKDFFGLSTVAYVHIPFFMPLK